MTRTTSDMQRKYRWVCPTLGVINFGLGAMLFFLAKATYEGYEMMTAMTVAILCWPAFHSLFTWRMLLLALLIIAPISLVFQCFAVHDSIWVYGQGRFMLGRMHWWQLEMPWMEVVFYFLFPFFQLGLFAFCCRRFPPRPLHANWSRIFPVLLLLAPLAFAGQGIYWHFFPWQSLARPFDWNCAIMGTAYAVTILAYWKSKPYRHFVRSLFFVAWTLGMGGYMLVWEQFHTVLHDQWRYVLNRNLFPPWILVDANRGLGLSQAQLYGYWMTATVFPAIAFLVINLWKGALQANITSSPFSPETILEPKS